VLKQNQKTETNHITSCCDEMEVTRLACDTLQFACRLHVIIVAWILYDDEYAIHAVVLALLVTALAKETTLLVLNLDMLPGNLQQMLFPHSHSQRANRFTEIGCVCLLVTTATFQPASPLLRTAWLIYTEIYIGGLMGFVEWQASLLCETDTSFIRYIAKEIIAYLLVAAAFLHLWLDRGDAMLPHKLPMGGMMVLICVFGVFVWYKRRATMTFRQNNQPIYTAPSPKTLTHRLFAPIPFAACGFFDTFYIFFLVHDSHWLGDYDLITESDLLLPLRQDWLHSILIIAACVQVISSFSALMARLIIIATDHTSVLFYTCMFIKIFCIFVLPIHTVNVVAIGIAAVCTGTARLKTMLPTYTRDIETHIRLITCTIYAILLGLMTHAIDSCAWTAVITTSVAALGTLSLILLTVFTDTGASPVAVFTEFAHITHPEDSDSKHTSHMA
jgi:hypothetical protein